jgi:CRISPR-associated protein Cas1
VARAVVSAGLNPAIGIFHSKNNNPFCLIDDLMEPFRPVIDFMVKSKLEPFRQERDLSPSTKKYIAGVIEGNLYFEDGAFNFTAGIQRYVQSYVSFLLQEEKINLPKIFK